MKPVSLLLVPMVALAVSGCTDAASQRRVADAPVVVHVAPVTIERSTPPVIATGTLGSKEEVTLSFKVDGVIARILVNEGDRVSGGQLLASLELGEIDPVVARAHAAVEKAERDHARAERLYADSVATLEQLQDAGTMRDAARAARCWRASSRRSCTSSSRRASSGRSRKPPPWRRRRSRPNPREGRARPAARTRSLSSSSTSAHGPVH